MGRIVTLCLLMGLATGCDRGAGYARPQDRNYEAIGAPQVTVGNHGLEVGTASTVQDLRGDSTTTTDEADTASNEPKDTAQQAPQRLTQSGQIASISPQRIMIETDSGETLDLGLRPMTTVTLDGKPSSLKALPEGADVRASFVTKGDERVAEKLDVRTNRKEHKTKGDQE